MEQQAKLPIVQQKLPYTSPQAIFVPLKLEERLRLGERTTTPCDPPRNWHLCGVPD